MVGGCVCVCMHTLQSFCFETQQWQLCSQGFSVHRGWSQQPCTVIQALKLCTHLHKGGVISSSLPGPIFLHEAGSIWARQGKWEAIWVWRDVHRFLFWGSLFRKSNNSPFSAPGASEGHLVAQPPLTQRALVTSAFWKVSLLPPGQLGECQPISHDFESVRWNSTFSHHFKDPRDRQMKWHNCAAGQCLVNLTSILREHSPLSPHSWGNRPKWKKTKKNPSGLAKDLLWILTSFESKMTLPGQWDVMWLAGDMDWDVTGWQSWISSCWMDVSGREKVIYLPWRRRSPLVIHTHHNCDEMTCLYDITHMWSPKNRTDELSYKTEKDPQI